MSKKTFLKEDEKMRIVVWFDRPHGEVCVADRLDTGKKGDVIPEDRIVRVPLEDAEDFIETILNAKGEDYPDFEGILEGAQRLADKQAADAVAFSDGLRNERKKRGSGGLINRNNNLVSVCMDELVKLRELKEKVTDALAIRDQAGDKHAREILDWMEDKELYEPR